tara:strand:- start:635 stop:1312 length:678 start_codon:yes stop_codon:yes gene_type:complete
MRILIASSKNWFNLKKDIQNDNEVKLISKKDELSLEFLNKFNPELIFFPHWNWVVSEEIYSQYKCIVFHTAPLPYGRGGSPIQNLILNNFEETPVCALEMTSELDAGPIYTKKTISLEGSLNEILKRINVVVNEMIEQLVSKLPTPVQQAGDIHIFKRLKDSDNEVDLNDSAINLYNKIRMLDSPDYPKAYIKIGNYKVEFSNAEMIDNQVTAKSSFVKIDESQN